MSLLPHEIERFTPIIDRILSTSDLEQTSTKRIRVDLETALGADLLDRKSAVNALIKERADVFLDRQANPTPVRPSIEPATRPTQVNGVAANHVNGSGAGPHAAAAHTTSSMKRPRSPSSDRMSDMADETPRKSRAKHTPPESDAAMAARLQAEENRGSRSTRGAGQKKRVPVDKKNTKKKTKSASRVKARDDSDLDSEGGEAKPVKRGGAFHKPFALSEPLAQLTDETTLSRPQTVKKIWEYIKAHDLQNPDDKRKIRCDDAMRAVFKLDEVHMFTMNKILAKHLFPLDE